MLKLHTKSWASNSHFTAHGMSFNIWHMQAILSLSFWNLKLVANGFILLFTWCQNVSYSNLSGYATMTTFFYINMYKLNMCRNSKHGYVSLTYVRLSVLLSHIIVGKYYQLGLDIKYFYSIFIALLTYIVFWCHKFSPELFCKSSSNLILILYANMILPV